MKRKNLNAGPSGRPRRNFSLPFLHSPTGKLSCILKKMPCIRAEVCAVQITSGGNLRSSGISRLSVRSLLSFLCGPRGKKWRSAPKFPATQAGLAEGTNIAMNL